MIGDYRKKQTFSFRRLSAKIGDNRWYNFQIVLINRKWSTTLQNLRRRWLALNVDELEDLTVTQIANKINNSFFKPLQEFQPLRDTDQTVDAALNVITFTDLEAYRCLKSLNPSKASGPDDIPSWLLKEYAVLLASPVTKILNCSFQENKLPKIWKLANVVPVPKSTPVKQINQHLRPISLTPILSKLAEDFVVSRQLKPAILKIIDPNQFGVIPGSSTSQALIKMIHCWVEATDRLGGSVRVVLFGYQKAFNLVDQTIIIDKLKSDSRFPN